MHHGSLLPLVCGATLTLGLAGCAQPGVPGPADRSTSEVSVTYCDKAENTRLVRVGIGGQDNVGETEATPLVCTDNGKPMGCTFSAVSPGTYRVLDTLSSAIVYAGPLPSPAGDAHVEMACQKACVDMVTVSSEGCGTTGKMRVYTADPAPVASLVGEYPWTAETAIKVGPTACAPLVAEVDTPDCGTLVAGLQPTGMRNALRIALAIPQVVDLTVVGPDEKPIPNAYISDDTFRTLHADAAGKATLRRGKDAPSSIWVQASGFGGGLFAVPRLPDGDGAEPSSGAGAASQPIAMPITLKPTHAVEVTCTQAGKPCAGPVVAVGTGMAARGCDAHTAGIWRCDATPDDQIWARQGTVVSPRVKVEDKAAVTVTMP